MIHILVVEDEKPISDLIRLSLSKASFHCTCAFDGAEAANLLEKNRYDLILLDVMLPEIDGFELMEYIQPLVELLARIDVVLRRYRKTDMVLEINGLKIDTASMRVWRAGQEVSLTKTEYELLLLFARNPRRAMYRETIYEHVWGEEYPFGSKAVDLHVQRLRKKVGWERCLQAVNRVGYRLEVEG